MLLQLVLQSGFAVALDERCSDSKDGSAECLKTEFRELSAFPEAPIQVLIQSLTMGPPSF